MFTTKFNGTDVIYTVLHIFRQVLFWAGNQDNHQKFKNPCYPIKMIFEMQHFFFEVKNSKWPTQKK